MDCRVKKIVFVTGTRADFGKLKPLISVIEKSPDYEYSIFVTGMHLLQKYGYTAEEVRKAGFKNIFTFMNQTYGESMEMVLANTIKGLSRYLHESTPDLLIVHGDRVEAMAGAIVGMLRNILVGHIEGGELSGTIDDLIRHSVTKMSHLHFVANENACNRLCQLGENKESIHVIGSPDIDIMLSDDLPSLGRVKKYYDIDFEKYAILLYHSVTTELDIQGNNAEQLVSAILQSKKNYVVIHPNNDSGSDKILDAYQRFSNEKRIKFLPSMRFEYFISLLKNSDFIIGNSSAGVREAPVFAVPSINVGSRQKNRYQFDTIVNIEPEQSSLFTAISTIDTLKGLKPSNHFGQGNSAENFLTALNSDNLWETPKQKVFCDIPAIFK